MYSLIELNIHSSETDEYRSPDQSLASALILFTRCFAFSLLWMLSQAIHPREQKRDSPNKEGMRSNDPRISAELLPVW